MTKHFLDPITMEAIRRRAYDIWQREGCSEGKSGEHWLRAETELHGEFASIPLGVGRFAARNSIYFWDHYG